MQINETIREIRKVFLPNFLGVEQVTQGQFGQIVARIARDEHEVDMLCSFKTIQSWEHGARVPSPIASKAISVIYDKTKGSIKPTTKEPRRIRSKLDEETVTEFVQRITN